MSRPLRYAAAPESVPSNGMPEYWPCDAYGRPLVASVAAGQNGIKTIPDTGTPTSVNDSATAVTILAANAVRLGAVIRNTSSALLHLMMGSTTPTTSNCSITIATGAAYEVPYGYTGIIQGIWATDPNDGAAVVTEFT